MTVTRYLGELAEHAHLVLSFANRDVRARYKQTVFGIAWAVVQPFSLMVAFTFVFSKVAGVPSDGVPYPIFAYSALLFWTFFAMCVSQGTLAMAANSTLVRRIYFPRETLLLAVLLSAGLDLAVSSTIFAGLMLYYQIPVGLSVLWAVPVLAVQVMLTFGLICVTSAIHVHFRDVGHGLPLVMQLWMFASPVAYPLSVVPASLRPIYLLNPMAGIIESYRRVILHGETPDLASLGLSVSVALALLSVGYLWFKRAERTFADVI
jgi:homopolymeric O-antigen transport system permease protein